MMKKATALAISIRFHSGTFIQTKIHEVKFFAY